MYITGAFMVPHPPLIIPEIGQGQEAVITNTIKGYKKVAQEVAALQPETIVVISPHTTMYADYFHISPGKVAKGDLSQFRARQISYEATYDNQMVGKICSIAQAQELMAGTLGERDKSLDHGTMVPLYFINQAYKEYRLVRVGLSGLPLSEHYALGQVIKEACEELERRTVIIASGDLSHCLKEDGPYGYKEEGPVYDQRIMEVMQSGDFIGLFQFPDEFRKKASECGHGAFLIMAGALDRTAVEVEKLSYEGPFGVGYGICSYRIIGSDQGRAFKDQFEKEEKRRLEIKKADEDSYVKLARASLETYIRTGKKLPMQDELDKELTTQSAGVFVSIKKAGQLRGCIGTIAPARENLATEIIENAVSAGTEDPRFNPVRPDELNQLEYSVDVLGEAEPVSSEAELDAKRYGVIVTQGNRRGLLLPNLEGVDCVKEQIAIARQKAGIGPEEQVLLERFEVVRHT